MRPLLLLPALGLLLTGCGQAAQSRLSQPSTPHDLAGQPVARPHADRVLVAGDATTVTTATGTFQVKVNGPALTPLPTFTKLPVGALHQYLATFTVTVTPTRGSQRLSPADFRLLALADQVDGGAIRTIAASATTLRPATVRAGSWTGTWTVPFTEGHGELLFTPAGASRPGALWDFRAES